MAILDIESLLQAISDAEPCGANAEDYEANEDLYREFSSLQRKARIIPERLEGNVIQPEQLPNWKDVRDDLLKLMAKTRDLRLLAEMARASLNIEGVVGLAESLELFYGSLDIYWDSIYPRLDYEDNNDPTQRVNIIKELCGYGSMLRFLQRAPLVESGYGRISLRDIQWANGKLQAPEGVDVKPVEIIKSAFNEAAYQRADRLDETCQALQKSFDMTGKIEEWLTDKLGAAHAPDLKPLRDKLNEALHVMSQYRPSSVSETTASAMVSEIPETVPKVALNGSKVLGGSINCRQDVIRALDLICEYYAAYETSSPVPLLIERAKRLVNMNFMEIIEDLAPDGLNQIKQIKGRDIDD